jgi:hypothetical protein
LNTETIIKKERVFVYEHSISQRFNPNVCPSCPFFKGTRTCMVHVSTVEKDTEITHIHRIAYLDTENPYKRKDTCEVQAKYMKPVYYDRQTVKNETSKTLPKVLVKRLLDVEAYASHHIPRYSKICAYHRKEFSRYLFRDMEGNLFEVEITGNYSYKQKPIKGVIESDFEFVRTQHDIIDPLWENLHQLFPKFSQLSDRELELINYYDNVLKSNADTRHLNIIGISRTDDKKFIAESNNTLYSCFYNQVNNSVDFNELVLWGENWVGYYTYFRWYENGKWVDIRNN